MIDGARTRDIQDHNLALYQLSYDHRRGPFILTLPTNTVKAAGLRLLSCEAHRAETFAEADRDKDAA